MCWQVLLSLRQRKVGGGKWLATALEFRAPACHCDGHSWAQASSSSWIARHEAAWSPPLGWPAAQQEGQPRGVTTLCLPCCWQKPFCLQRVLGAWWGADWCSTRSPHVPRSRSLCPHMVSPCLQKLLSMSPDAAPRVPRNCSPCPQMLLVD